MRYEGDIKDLEVMELGDMKVMPVDDYKIPLYENIPYWVYFIQPGSVKENKKFKGRTGQFFFRAFDNREDETQEVSEEDMAYMFSEKLRLLYIGHMGYKRALMPEFGTGENQPLCKSRDGVWPSPELENPVAEKCTVWKDGRPASLCPKSIWGTEVKGDRKVPVPPECTETVLHAFFDIDRKAPILIPIKGMQHETFNAWRRTTPTLVHRVLTTGMDPSSYYVQVTQRDQGTYWQMVFTFVKDESLDLKKFLPVIAWHQANSLPDLSKEPPKPELGELDYTDAIDVTPENSDKTTQAPVTADEEEALMKESAEDSIENFDV
jgi:hypothetical protein